jgi:hypothetical protein
MQSTKYLLLLLLAAVLSFGLADDDTFDPPTEYNDSHSCEGVETREECEKCCESLKDKYIMISWRQRKGGCVCGPTEFWIVRDGKLILVNRAGIEITRRIN